MKQTIAAALVVAAPACAQNVIGPGQTYQTQAYQNDIASICAGSMAFPTRPPLTTLFPQHVLATSGTPKIEQYRNGSLIATYSSFVNQPSCSYQGYGRDATDPGPAAATGCGAFTYAHSYRMYEPGDTFLVYPAVYREQPWIGPQYGDPVTPDNVTLEGVVQNNTIPVILLDTNANGNTLNQSAVLWATSKNFTLAHIAIQAVPGAAVGNSALYIDGAAGGKMLDVRITGFEQAGISPGVGADGILGSVNNSGTFIMEAVELDHNGGQGTSGNNHNAYFSASATDPHYKILMRHSWSHDAYYGHLFKSRAQVNELTADYFQGGTPQGGIYAQAEAYGVDIANGGLFTMTDVIVSKGMSGLNSNPIEVTFGEEGNPDGRPDAVSIRNSTFVADALTIDGGNNPIPLRLAAGTQSRILDNVFAGFCPAGNTNGDVTALALPSELTSSGSLASPVLSNDAAIAAAYPGYVPIAGRPSYVHAARGTPRHSAAVGAKD